MTLLRRKQESEMDVQVVCQRVEIFDVWLIQKMRRRCTFFPVRDACPELSSLELMSNDFRLE